MLFPAAAINQIKASEIKFPQTKLWYSNCLSKKRKKDIFLLVIRGTVATLDKNEIIKKNCFFRVTAYCDLSLLRSQEWIPAVLVWRRVKPWTSHQLSAKQGHPHSHLWTFSSFQPVCMSLGQGGGQSTWREQRAQRPRPLESTQSLSQYLRRRDIWFV